MLNSKTVLLLFLTLTVLSSPTKAAIITITGMNEDFNLRELKENDGAYSIEAVGPVGSTPQYRFNIPDEYVRTNSAGQIDLWRSLERWRVGTDKGIGLPYTDNSTGQRIPYFPVASISRGGIVQMTDNRYIALPFLLERKRSHPNLRVTARDGREVSLVVPRSALAESIAALGRANRPVNCRSNSGRAAECMICNCANEAGSDSEGHIGKVAVNRTVLARLTRGTYPDTICGVIWQPSQFSWTFGGRLMSRKEVKGNDLKNCVRASMEAVASGPWRWDMFYNPDGLSPAWASKYSHRGNFVHANHKFMDSGARPKSDGQRLLRRAIDQGASGVD